jgi:soluble lytic murein transglycosylase-like protein
LQLVFAAGLIAPAAPCLADIYRYIDANGVMHFTNAPTSGRYKIYIRELRTVDPRGRVPAHYEPIIAEAAERHGLSQALIKAVIMAESDFDPRAVSKRGAMGLMQIMPHNLRLLNVRDPFNPRQNIMGGARYLREMLERFGKNLQLALAAYNAGPGAVEQYRSIPPFPETQQYIQKVLRYYGIFRKG